MAEVIIPDFLKTDGNGKENACRDLKVSAFQITLNCFLLLFFDSRKLGSDQLLITAREFFLQNFTILCSRAHINGWGTMHDYQTVK